MDSDVVGEATWTGLEHPSVQAAPAARPDADPHVYHEVHLNVRALQSVLSSAAVAKSTVACLCAGYCAVFYVYLPGQAESYPAGSRAHRAEGVMNVCTYFSDLEVCHFGFGSDVTSLPSQSKARAPRTPSAYGRLSQK